LIVDRPAIKVKRCDGFQPPAIDHNSANSRFDRNGTIGLLFQQRSLFSKEPVMSRAVRLLIGSLAVGAVLMVVGLNTRGVREAAAQVPAARTQWEYQSASIEIGALGPKLNEWGNDGWEVTSVVSTETALDTQDSEKPRLHCQRVEVVAKRPRSR
jgi:hypothetical protein